MSAEPNGWNAQDRAELAERLRETSAGGAVDWDRVASEALAFCDESGMVHETSLAAEPVPSPERSEDAQRLADLAEWLDAKGAPTKDVGGVLSPVGRVMELWQREWAGLVSSASASVSDGGWDAAVAALDAAAEVSTVNDAEVEGDPGAAFVFGLDVHETLARLAAAGWELRPSAGDAEREAGERVTLVRWRGQGWQQAAPDDRAKYEATAARLPGSVEVAEFARLDPAAVSSDDSTEGEDR